MTRWTHPQPAAASSVGTAQSAGLAAELERFGFNRAGAWFLDGSAKGGVRFSLNMHRNDRAVYAFVVNGRAEYIGICDSTATTLVDRMSRYQNLVGAGTNARILELIKAAVQSGAEVLIYAMVPPTGPSHLNRDVDYIKGLEYPLIDKFKPSWNRRR